MRWTLEEFDRQPFPFVMELLEHWANDPPAHWVLQAVHGFKAKNKGRRDSDLSVAHRVVDSTVTDERKLPGWVQEARRMERERTEKK